MNTKVLQILVLLILFFNTAFSQNKISPREMFLEAESYFLFEEYNEALPFLIQLSELYPENDNIKYKLGRCYLNIPYEKHKSIVYLEKACKNINPHCKSENMKETAAPIEAIFFLADAYRVNNQIEKAIEEYERFMKVSDPDIFDYGMVYDQIIACKKARILEKHPLNISFDNLGENINTHFAENNAVVSADESMLVFSVQLRFYHAIFYSSKENGNWTLPTNIISDLGVDNDCFPVGISSNGKELLLYRNNEYMGDLYVSRFINGKWSKIKMLNNNINTKFWESHACFSSDGKRLYFTSNRKGGNGGLDIYMSTRDDTYNDDWSEAINLGTTVNSSFNEETPFLSADDSKLFFSSLGHNGMGGYDIFVSELNNSSWTKPKNMGYPLNTTDNDLFFQPIGDGSEGYMSLLRKDTYGKNDIYKVKISSPIVQFNASNQSLMTWGGVTTPIQDNKKDNSIKKISYGLQNLAVFINQLTITQFTVVRLFASLQSETKSAQSDTSKLTDQTSDDDTTLTPGQRQAWHKLLYGGLGILAVFVFFILFLYLKSRKGKNEQDS